MIFPASLHRAPGSKLLLVLVVTFYGLSGLTFSVIFPLGEGPDEPAHFFYVQFVARNWRLPVLKPLPEENETVEACQPPLYYFAGALLTFPWMGSEPQILFDPPSVPAGKQPLFHHSEEANFPWRGGTLAWHLLRLYSVGLGGLTLWAVYRAGIAFFRNRWLAVASMAYVGLNPQFVYIHSIVNNDAGATAIGSLILCLMVTRTRPEDHFRFRTAGFLIAAAALTKATVLLLVPGLALLFITSRPQPAPTASHWKSGLLWLVLTPTILSGWWFLRNLWLYGDWLGLSQVAITLWQNYHPEPLSLTQFIAILPRLAVRTLRSYWAQFGWMGFELPRRIFNAVAVVHLVFWLPLLGSIRPRLLRDRRASALALSTLSLLLGYCYYNTIANHSGWQGRFLLPVSLVAALAFIEGCRRLFGRWERALALAVVASLALLMVYCFLFVIQPAYLS